MPKRITIAPHLSMEELEARFRQAKTTTQAHHYQIIWLLAMGKTTAEVMAVTGYSRGWIYELVSGYNHLGPESLGDQRDQNRDSDPLLNDIEQAQLWQVLQQPPLDGGLWNGRKVADWMSELKGYKVSRQRGWEYLKSMKFRLRVPRPEHQQSDLRRTCRNGKKNLGRFVKKIKKENPSSDVEVWSMDEHRLGLKPVLRREWVDEFSNATAVVNWRFQWLWLYRESTSEYGRNILVDTAICQQPAFRASFRRFCQTLESRIEKKSHFS